MEWNANNKLHCPTCGLRPQTCLEFHIDTTAKAFLRKGNVYFLQSIFSKVRLRWTMMVGYNLHAVLQIAVVTHGKS